MYAKPESDGSFTLTISGEQAAKPMVQAFLNAIVKEDELHLRVLETIYDQLPRIVTNIEMSSSGLNRKFKALASSAMNQANNFEKFTKIAKSIEYEGKKISMLEAFALIDKSIGLSVEKTLFVSKMAIAMVYSLDEAMKALKEIETNLNHISRNASDSEEAINLMKQKLTIIHSAMTGSFSILEELATIDMNDNVIVKDSLNLLMHTIKLKSQFISDSMQDAIAEARSEAEGISALSSDMEFQNKAVQWINNSLAALKLLVENIKLRKNQVEFRFPITVNSSQAIEFANTFKLSELQNYFVDQLISNGNMNEQALFKSFAFKPSTTTPATAFSDDDSVF